MGALRGRSANTVVAHDVTKEMLWRPLRSHCVYTALILRFYGVFTAYHLPYCVSVAFARHFHGVHGARVCARVELLSRLQGVLTACVALRGVCARVELLPRSMPFYDKT